VAETPKIA